jgi:hypothetical protein
MYQYQGSGSMFFAQRGREIERKAYAYHGW